MRLFGPRRSRKPRPERLNLLFDEIGVEQLLEDDTSQVVDGLPVVPKAGRIRRG